MTDPRFILMEQEIPRLRRYARYLTRDVEWADDLVQETLVGAMSRVGNWTPGTNLRAWLFVILRNTFISDLRRMRRSPTRAPVDDAHPGYARHGNQEPHLQFVELAHALETISGEHREVLVLVAVEGMKYEEAAEVLGVPVGTVRSRLSRARIALRELLEGEGEAGRGGAA